MISLNNWFLKKNYPLYNSFFISFYFALINFIFEREEFYLVPIKRDKAQDYFYNCKLTLSNMLKLQFKLYWKTTHSKLCIIFAIHVLANLVSDTNLYSHQSFNPTYKHPVMFNNDWELRKRQLHYFTNNFSVDDFTNSLLFTRKIAQR